MSSKSLYWCHLHGRMWKNWKRNLNTKYLKWGPVIWQPLPSKHSRASPRGFSWWRFCKSDKKLVLKLRIDLKLVPTKVFKQNLQSGGKKVLKSGLICEIWSSWQQHANWKSDFWASHWASQKCYKTVNFISVRNWANSSRSRLSQGKNIWKQLLRRFFL